MSLNLQNSSILEIKAVKTVADTTLFFLFTETAGVMGAPMDNILAVATFIAVVNDMTDLGLHNCPLWWGLLFAGTFFGNLTLIGSTANIVSLGMLEWQKHADVSLLRWLMPGALVSVPTLLLAMLMILFRSHSCRDKLLVYLVNSLP